MQSLPTIHTSFNIWKKSIDLRLFWTCLVEPFLRPLMLKNIRGWILGFGTQKFSANCEKSAANLKKVRQTPVWLTIQKFEISSFKYFQTVMAKKHKFVCSFFGRIHGAAICFRFYLTFRDLKNKNKCLQQWGVISYWVGSVME